jgi:type I restriction enzyme, R subunit
MNKKSLSESDICAEYITPALIQAGWDEATQLRREVYFTNGQIIMRGR